MIKISFSKTDAAKANVDGKTFVSRTTIFVQNLDITTSPDFSEAMIIIKVMPSMMS